MQKAYRYRLYPTAEQTQMMTRITGCCRFTYNRLLEYCSKSYKRRGESHTSFDLNNFICHTLKKAYPWLSDAPAQTLQCVSADLSSAFKAFFRFKLCIQSFLQEGCFLPEVQVQAPLEEEFQNTSEREGRC